jgi:hypothetical protein
MAYQVFLGFAWVAVLIGGLVGLKHAPALGALLLVGFFVKKFLDTFWSVEIKDGKMLDLEEPEAPFRPAVLNPLRDFHQRTGWMPAGSSYASSSYTPRRLVRR